MAASAQTSAESGPKVGLRERKKIKTRTAIREATYRLIEEQGYDATTVEQIAEAAEVSPSTVFRYFPTKEDIVLTDEFDPVLERELRARPADEPIIDSVRHVVEHALELAFASEPPEVVRLRTRLQVETPAVRSRMMESMSVTGQLMCQVIADRTGRDADGLEVRVYAMALVGALMQATMYWAEHDHEDDLRALVLRALDTVQQGL
ncbi:MULTISPECIES: TetR family transcriptional regulator [unclassified Streptomyces]|uniref:TetR/AcrR family transcriptional regulator n=1 Tax=unclassified Streptomyces TaxID=2593676 RepID=UPI000DBAA040|nr:MULTISPECIES: TetR family transcriptional regulator [unclassified Streptomyces]MYT68790.1 TetR family transcriptional regulator [Streptomyces sp. SID8367]